jgi:hypothetical protein
MALFGLRPLLLLQHSSHNSSPSWHMISLFKAHDNCQESQKTIFLFLNIIHTTYNFLLQRQLHVQDNLFILSKIKVYWESESLNSPHCVYYYQPLTRHCLLLIARPQSLRTQMFLLAYLLLLWDYVCYYNANNPLWQWPTSSLSAGEEKVVTIVYKMAIALCSHWLVAPKWLLLLIITNLVILALKLGDGQKIELTVGPRQHPGTTVAWEWFPGLPRFEHA